MKQQSWFYRNRVVLLGLLTSVITGVLQVTQNTEMTTVNWLAMAYAAVMAALSFAANNLRGKWVSLTGIIGTLSTAVTTVYANPHLNWQLFLSQLIGSLLLAVLAIVAPPPKPVTYEHDATIVEAKEQPQLMKKV